MCTDCRCDGADQVTYHGSILAVKNLADALGELLGRRVTFCEVHRAAVRHLRQSLRVVRRRDRRQQELYREFFAKLAGEKEPACA